jgi:uncharacterized protein
VELESYTIVLLRRPPDHPDLAEDEIDRLQEQHLAHLQELREHGPMVLSGPFDDQVDESLRGLSIFRCSIEEARDLMDQDPMVQVGWLAVDVFTWLMPKGAVTFHPNSST